jgi:hypothetical protein
MYVPFARPEIVYAPPAPEITLPEEGPVYETVTPATPTFPEIEKVVGAGVKFTPVMFDVVRVSFALVGENV